MSSSGVEMGTGHGGGRQTGPEGGPQSQLDIQSLSKY